MIRKSLAGDWRGPSVYDPAIDWSRSPRLEYIETRDAAKLVYYEGEAPTIWVLRALTQSQVAAALQESPPLSYLWAFLTGLRAVEGSGAGDYVFDQAADQQRRRLSEDSFDRLVPAKVWRELGKLCLDRAELSEGEQPRFALPAGSPLIPTRRAPTTASDASGSQASGKGNG